MTTVVLVVTSSIASGLLSERIAQDTSHRIEVEAGPFVVEIRREMVPDNARFDIALVRKGLRAWSQSVVTLYSTQPFERITMTVSVSLATVIGYRNRSGSSNRLGPTCFGPQACRLHGGRRSADQLAAREVNDAVDQLVLLTVDRVSYILTTTKRPARADNNVL